MRLLSALEELLDPVVGLLDALPAHFSADLAPADVLELLTRWLGIELDESQPTAERRQIVRSAAELGRLRGTRRGLELTLSLAFPGVPFRVDEVGSVLTLLHVQTGAQHPDRSRREWESFEEIVGELNRPATIATVRRR